MWKLLLSRLGLFREIFSYQEKDDGRKEKSSHRPPTPTHTSSPSKARRAVHFSQHHRRTGGHDTINEKRESIRL